MIIVAVTTLFEWVMSLVANLFPIGGLDPSGQYVLLPFGIDSALSYVVGIWNTFLVTVPYAVVVWHMFLYFVVPFEVGLLVVKLVLGSRAPVHNIN